ncbi:enoyl-CoA hydratase/isomerase family protein [Desertihabitans brevis]|uniref:3-hydroxyisobutyryl-CoA hydrolase n=1 Tax=Desertihabitans brevis TaxID=2268447 RepID=A0A367YVZ2_9ACTN|nr:enoyl-CoA hydratase/isomerase family protein [Desertihabitans brevis]RCK69699.1 enoyl-CoA hydratase/isomerase family protein [Desertihabitans brevis]
MREDAWQPTPTTADVLTARTGALGRIRLNRPQSINALTTPMVVAVRRALHEHAEAGAGAVLLDGAGERGLCAGGDVRAVRESVLAGTGAGVEFFAEEYATDAAVADAPVPVVAWMDGIVMGGGVGLSVHAAVRCVTGRTRLAMPETIIGFFPDVGALWWLSRAPGQRGTRMALTGGTVGGADAVALGLADRLLGAGQLPEVVDRLAAGGDVSGLGAGREEVTSAWLTDGLDPFFAGDDPVAVVQRLEAADDPVARAAAADIRARSPFAVAVTLAALRRAETMTSLADVLEQDRRLAPRLAAHPDFAEGVRAQLVDKDRTPRWTHARLEDVDPTEVAAVLD